MTVWWTRVTRQVRRGEGAPNASSFFAFSVSCLCCEERREVSCNPKRTGGARGAHVKVCDCIDRFG